MSSFATELAHRLTRHEGFWSTFDRLQSTGAGSVLPNDLQNKYVVPASEELNKLLYCASVFAQTNDDGMKALAQSIALNALLVDSTNETRTTSARVLTELGNFPGVSYVEKHFPTSTDSLIEQLGKRISKELNGVQMGARRWYLTDYQKTVWDALPDASALAVSAPTSAGKSFLIIEHLCRLASDSEKFAAVYVAPTRALLSEVYQSINSRIGDTEGVRVSTVPSIDAEKHPRQIFVLTQERLQVLLSISEMSFDLAVVDEAQNLSDGSRGMILQEVIADLVSRNAKMRLVLLAPGADGFEDAALCVGVPLLKAATTNTSPVLQNRIVVSSIAGKNQLRLSLLTPRGTKEIGLLTTNRGFDLPNTRLAAVALELGANGGSLVYATGPTDAEVTSMQLAQECKQIEDDGLEKLATFIEEHIHPEYKLANLVRKGIAFHYGKMPALLRESLEQGFKDRALRFLVCTTTLFQGVNLPARSVFIDTPTRGSGKGTTLDPALLWNFAGRAGRMNKDIVGNVFLVDYTEWSQHPLTDFVRFKIKPSFRATMMDHYEKVLEALSGKMPNVMARDDVSPRVRASAGLLIARALKGNLATFLQRASPDLAAERKQALTVAATSACSNLGIPASIIAANWTIDPFGQQRLFNRIVEKIKAGEIDALIPLNPNNSGSGKLYAGIFNRILRSVYQQQGNFGAYVSTIAIPWMKGIPYPVILAKAVDRARKEHERKLEETQSPAKRKRRAPRAVDSSKVIRGVFEIIEDVVRFHFVQLGRAYIDLLRFALIQEQKLEAASTIFDFSLALELGVSTATGQSLVELGLSRIAASALEKLYPNSNLTVAQTRDWLRELDVEVLQLNAVIVDELQRLQLVPALRENIG